MAFRPIFIPCSNNLGVQEQSIEFKWHPGFAKSQKQKSIQELHTEAKNFGIQRVLEISSKSEIEIGTQLSAFNLTFTTKKQGKTFTIETAFQGSKVFENGGPFKDLFGMDSLAAKRDPRLKTSGNLIHFDFYGQIFPLMPRTFFYDWLYINALVQHEHLTQTVLEYDAFSDIEFNPDKSINCQAHSVALYVNLYRNNVLNQALSSPNNFKEVLKSYYPKQQRAQIVQTVLL